MTKNKSTTGSPKEIGATLESLLLPKSPMDRSSIEAGYAPDHPVVGYLLRPRPGTKGLVRRTEELEARLVPPDGPLTKKQVMALCGFKVTKLGQLLRDGTLRKVPSDGKEVLVSRASVEAYRRDKGHTAERPQPPPKTKGRPRRPKADDPFDLTVELKKLKK